MLLLHTDDFPHYGLERVFEFAKESGFDGIELGVNGNFDTRSPEYLKKLEHRFKLKICAFSLSARYEEKLLESFQHTVREFPGVTVNINSPKTLSFAYKKWIKNIAPRLARKYDLTLCRKNTPLKMMFWIIPKRSDNSLFALKKTGKVCLDLTALGVSREEIIRAISFLGKSLKHVYLSNIYKGMPYSLPQHGILPVESFLTRLKQTEYKGNFTLRVDGRNLFEGDDEKVVITLKDVRAYFEKYFVNIEK